MHYICFLSIVVNMHLLFVQGSTNYLLETTHNLINLIKHRHFVIFSMWQHPNSFCISSVLDWIIEITIGLWNSSLIVCESDMNDTIQGLNKNVWTISNKIGTMLSVEQPLAFGITIVFLLTSGNREESNTIFSRTKLIRLKCWRCSKNEALEIWSLMGTFLNEFVRRIKTQNLGTFFKTSTSRQVLQSRILKPEIQGRLWGEHWLHWGTGIKYSQSKDYFFASIGDVATRYQKLKIPYIYI